MMAYNANLILAGQQPDLLGVMERSDAAAQQRVGFDRQNALSDLYRTQGPGIAAGDPGAVNALARFDPMAAMGVQDSITQRRYAAQDQQMQEGRYKREVEQYAAGLSAAEAAAKAADLESDLKGAAVLYESGDRAGYDAHLRQNGLDPAEYPFDQFPAASAEFMTWADILGKRSRGELIEVSPGATMYDPATNQGVYTAPAKPETGMGAEISPQARLYAEETGGMVPKGTFAQTYGADPMAEEKARLEVEKLRAEISAPPKQPAPVNVRDGDRLVDPSSGKVVYQAQPEVPAAEARISRLTEGGIDRATAIAIVDGRYELSRDPMTGEAVVLDVATGARVGAGSSATAPAASTGATQAPAASPYGEAYPNAPAAFGVSGFLGGMANTAFDTAGLGTPFPDVQTSQDSFAVTAETIVRDIANAYQRQPPAELLKAIRALVPNAGSPFVGANSAASKMRALGRSLTEELANIDRQSSMPVRPEIRQELAAQRIAVTSGLSRIDEALRSLSPKSGATVRPEVEERLKAYE